MQKRTPPSRPSPQDELDDALNARFDAVSIRSIECIASAARSILGTEDDHWREQLAADAPEIRALVAHTLGELGYQTDGRLLSRTLGPKAAAKVQDVYVIRRWLDKNSRHTTSKPILQRRMEYQALLQLNAYELSTLTGIAHSDPGALELSLFVGMNNIAPPTTGAARLQ